MLLDSKILSLLKVVETGNYTLAGKELNLTQPAISQHIRAIETEFHIHVFERVDKKLILTREGEILVRYCRRMQALYNNLSKDLQNGAARMHSLNIGVTRTMEYNRISEVLARYAGNHNGATITLETDTLGGLRERVHNYELDFAIIDNDIRDNGITTMLMDTDEMVLVVPPDHPLARLESVTIDDIRSENIILWMPDPGSRDLVRASVKEKGINEDDLNIILEVENLSTVKDLISHGFGVSILLKSVCISEIRRQKLTALPFKNLNLSRNINFIYSKDFPDLQILEGIAEVYRNM
jgi:DNA-binding transcriptional LysR family regulator